MLTADTITDEQIREMERSLNSAIRGVKQFGRAVATDALVRLEAERDTCITALHEHDYPQSRIDARARCALIINAREASKTVR
jgi:hypothetical protein